MKTRFSLRTLMVALTLAAIGLAVVGNRLIEERRQERLVDEVLQTPECGPDVLCCAFTNGTVELFLNDDIPLSEGTARKLVGAKRITLVHTFHAVPPPCYAILKSEFVERPLDDDGVSLTWLRKGARDETAEGSRWYYENGKKHW